MLRLLLSLKFPEFNELGAGFCEGSMVCKSLIAGTCQGDDGVSRMRRQLQKLLWVLLHLEEELGSAALLHVRVLLLLLQHHQPLHFGLWFLTCLL